MSIPAEAPGPFASSFRTERARLLELLGSLSRPDWSRPTACPGWDVLDLAVHIVGVDLSLLAWQRDGHRGTPPPPDLSEGEFIAWIDALQAEWVHAARRLSPRLVTEILEWTNEPIIDLIGAQNPSEVSAQVSWASRGLVPVWLDQGRELSERWIHRQQLLEAVGLPSDLRADLADPVLNTLRWALPYRLDACTRPVGSTITITVDGSELHIVWNLSCHETGWEFGTDSGEPLARIRLSAEQAWRLLTNNYRPESHGNVDTSGDSTLIDVIMTTRAIIGVPK